MATAGTTRPAAAGHRARITGGLAAAIAEKGYAAVTIADVVRLARVSKRTFYEHFADKEACFVALYAETSDELLALIAATAANVAGPWEERLGAAARAYFERVAAEPELIRAALLEIQAAGPRARELRRDVQRRYAELLRTLTTGAVGNWLIQRETKTLVPQMEAEIIKLGRYYGTSSVAMPQTAATEETAKQAV